MKAYLLALACLMSFTFNATAQLPNGSVAPDFTITDLDGNEHRLYDLLDQGYSVVIDLNATWCGPCWNYHTGGALEELWENHGPAGGNGVSSNTSDDVYVFMIESQSTNTINQLYGTEGTTGDGYADNTYGDWVTGTQFPIADDATVANLYNLAYYPTIFTICPNRILTESGAISASNHYNLISECVTAVEGTNAAIQNVSNGLVPEGCESVADGELTVFVQNMGTEVLTSFTVEVSANGQNLATEDYNGSLETYAMTTFEFEITVDSETVDVEITTADDNNADNTMSQSIDFSSGQTSQSITVNLLTDNFGNETYMEITDENGIVVWSEGNEGVAGISGTGQLAPADATNPLGNNQSYNWNVDLPSTDCFKFMIYDYYGDGLAASTNTNGGVDGNWSIENSSGIVIAEQMVQNFENTDDASFENTEPSSIYENKNVELSIYPNPVQTNTKLSVNLSESSDARLDVLNILGQTVLSNVYSLGAGNNTIDINVDEMTNGIYFAHLSINGEINTVKITVSK